jgi:hypothetical protein
LKYPKIETDNNYKNNYGQSKKSQAAAIYQNPKKISSPMDRYAYGKLDQDQYNATAP